MDGSGYFVNPTLFTDVTDDMKIAREEIFGPVLVAMPYDDLEEVARRANDTEYGLAAGVWTRDVANAHKMAKLLQAGNVYINVLRARRPGGAVRRLQGVRHRPRDGPREPRRLSRAEDGLDQPYVGAGRLSDWRIGVPHDRRGARMSVIGKERTPVETSGPSADGLPVVDLSVHVADKLGLDEHERRRSSSQRSSTTSGRSRSRATSSTSRDH